MLRVIKNMISMMRSASKRIDYNSTWQPRMNPIDLAVLTATVTGQMNRRMGIQTPMGMADNDSEDSKRQEPKDTRIEKKPVEVLHEILTEKPTFTVADVKHQIKVIANRLKVLKEQGVSAAQLGDEERALAYLKAREKYAKAYKLFKWPTSNQEKVIALQQKYKLHTTELGDFARHIPQEAIDEIEKYAQAYAEVRKDKPEFRLIVDEEIWQEIQAAKKKKDPILLALSPFGNWYYVLGAWDKEVQYVDDLIYHGK